MSLPEQDIIKRWQIDNKALPKPEKDMEFKTRGDKEYDIKTIIDSAM